MRRRGILPQKLSAAGKEARGLVSFLSVSGQSQYLRNQKGQDIMSVRVGITQEDGVNNAFQFADISLVFFASDFFSVFYHKKSQNQKWRSSVWQYFFLCLGRAEVCLIDAGVDWFELWLWPTDCVSEKPTSCLVGTCSVCGSQFEPSRIF